MSLILCILLSFSVLGWGISVPPGVVLVHFNVGAINGPLVPFLLNFETTTLTTNFFPVDALQSYADINNANFSRILYARGMANLIALPFNLSMEHETAGVLNMWNASVAYCYKNYRTDRYGSIQLGAKCQQRYVYGSTIERYTNLTTAESRATLLGRIIHSTNKTALEYDPAQPNVFLVHTHLPEVDNISTDAIPIILALFFMSWLVWSQDITTIVHQSQPTLQPIWTLLCTHYGVFIIDALLLCVCTDILNVLRGFAVLRGGDAIQLVGIDWALRLLRYNWALLLVVFAFCIVCIMSYGFSRTLAFQQLQQRYQSPSSVQGLGTVILSGVGTGLVLFFLEDIQSAPLVILCVAGALFISLVSLFKNNLLVWLYTSWNVSLHQHEVQFLLMFRWMLEFIVLTTLHAALPTMLNDILTTTYRNGLGFFLGLAMCIFEGRDLTMALYHDWRATTFSTPKRLGLAALYLLAAIASGMYLVVFMLGPALIASIQLEQDPTTALYVASAFGVQAFAMGSLYASHTLTFPGSVVPSI
jgi:hypothetical protein